MRRNAKKMKCFNTEQYKVLLINKMHRILTFLLLWHEYGLCDIKLSGVDLFESN